MTLTNLSPLDGRYADKCDTLRNIASEYGLIRYRLLIEIAWFKALCAEPKIKECPTLSKDTSQSLDTLIKNFKLEDAVAIKEIEKTTNHDVKAVEYFLKNHFQNNAELKPLCEFIHFACTSEDINNLSYGLMLKDLRQLMLNHINTFKAKLDELSQKTKNMPLLSLTHGQPASPTTLGKELANFSHRLQRQMAQLEKMPILGKINGAVGNFNAHIVAYPHVDWLSFSKHFVENLGLNYNAYTTQIEPHDNQAEMYDCLCRINTILIDFSRDMWGYISRGVFKQKMVENEVGSSTMPHKVNPIDFENAEGNLGLANALFEHLARKLPISRFQRDLTDSTVQRNIGTGFGYTLIALQALQKGLSKVEACPEAMAARLNQSWEVLTEAVQTVMRRYQMDGAYEKLKTLSRGKTLTQKDFESFIQTLEIPEEAKGALLSLSPLTYTGMAEVLAEAAGRDLSS